MNNNLLTNTLLVIIAVLLLVQVIQTGMNQQTAMRPAMPMSPHSYQGGRSDEGSDHTGPSHGDMGASAPHAMQMPVEMVFRALKAFPAGCNGKAALIECDSPAARAVKAQIEKFQEQGKGPRETFDYIVKTWGEGALSEEAASIRRQRMKSR